MPRPDRGAPPSGRGATGLHPSSRAAGTERPPWTAASKGLPWTRIRPRAQPRSVRTSSQVTPASLVSGSESTCARCTALPVEAGRPSSDGRRSWFHRHATVARSRMLPARVCDRGAFAAGLREPPPSDRPIVAYLGLVIACGRITGEYRPYDRRSEWEAVPHVLCSRHGNLVFIPRDERSICCRHLDLPSDGSQYASRPGIIGT